MLDLLRRPRWIIATILVLTLAAVFVRLGLWQLDRHEERQSENVFGAEQLAKDPLPLAELVAIYEDGKVDIEYRRVTVPGSPVTDEEVLIRSQVHLGTAGFHVVTPYESADGAVLVNRGWVPLAMDEPPIENARPGGGEVEGYVHLSQTRPPLGPEDPPGDLDVFNRVDIARIQQQVSLKLAPFYLVQTSEPAGDLPALAGPPDFDDSGPHLAYAIQWFGFAAVGLVGFGFLLRRAG